MSFESPSDLVGAVTSHVLGISALHEIQIELTIHQGALTPKDADHPGLVRLRSGAGEIEFIFDVHGDAWLVCRPKGGASHIRRITLRDSPNQLVLSCMRAISGCGPMPANEKQTH
jgi:hypothetical protein